MPRHKEFEEAEVLEKALDIFWSNGYNATSFQILTEGMCINRQSIYDTYGDKHTLFIKSFLHYTAKNEAVLKAYFGQDKPVLELLHTFFNTMIDEIRTDALKKGCLVINSMSELVPHDAEAKQIVENHLDFFLRTLQSLVARGISNGEISPAASSEALALHLVNTIYGIKTLGKAMDDRNKLQTIADMALSVIPFIPIFE
jgi:TetR/AcrR family transcriptional repressor of nem operon